LLKPNSDDGGGGDGGDGDDDDDFVIQLCFQLCITSPSYLLHHSLYTPYNVQPQTPSHDV